jgi:hypothetical protein
LLGEISLNINVLKIERARNVNHEACSFLPRSGSVQQGDNVRRNGDRMVNWDALGAIGEIVGAVLVLATLVYLASQIRQTNEISRFGTTKDIMVKFDLLNDRLVADSGLRHALHTSEPLTEEEKDLPYSFVNMWANTWIICQSAHDNGPIDDGFYLTAKKDVLVEIDRWRNIGPFVNQFLDNFPVFRDYEIFEELRRKSS